MLTGWRLDAGYALRAWAKNRGTTAAALAALALGIGANTAIFSVVHAVLLRRLPYPDEASLVQIWGSNPARNVPFHNVFYSDVAQWRSQASCFEGMAAAVPGAANLLPSPGEQAQPERIPIVRANASFLPLLGARYVHGGPFLSSHDYPGAPRVIVLSHGLWTRRFSADPAVIGRTVLLDGTGHTVTGVLAPEFYFAGRPTEAYVPLAAAESGHPTATLTVTAFARLRAGVTLEQAQAEMNVIGKRLQASNPRSIGTAPRVCGVRDFVVREVRRSLWTLLAAVGMVLLIACANVANLMLARAGARQRELSIRRALGASNGRLIRQFLTESVLLAVAGAALGVLLAWWGVRTLIALVPAGYPLIKDSSIGIAVLLFTLGLSVLTGVLFGTAPALAVTRLHGFSASRGRARFGSLLVAAQVGIALVLLIGAGLVIRSFAHLRAVDPGFRPQGVLTAAISLPGGRYAAERNERLGFYDRLIARLESMPGVQAAGLTTALPLTGFNQGTGMLIEGRPFPPPDQTPIVWFRVVSPGYFKAMEIPLRAGRMISEADTLQAPPVALINETCARRFWPDTDPVGKRFTNGPPAAGRPVNWITVVGVVGDLHHKGLNEETDAEIFWPYRQPAAVMSVTLVVRTPLDAAAFGPQLRVAAAEVDRDVPLSQVRTMEEVVAGSISPQRLLMILLGLFAILALVLAAVGIYAVVSYSVERRTREIGLRMALGAGRGDVLRLIVKQAMAPSFAGAVAGLVAAYVLVRFIRSLLYNVSPFDPLLYCAVALLLLGVALCASLLPARRATRVEPMAALRYE